MITFKAIVIPNNRRKDGTYPVKIRVTFKGVSRRLPTTLVCTPSDLTRSLKIKSPDILNRAEELIGNMRNAVKDLSPFTLDEKDVDWVVGHIKLTLSAKEFSLDFFEWADKFLQTKITSTRGNYITALNTFADFLGTRKIDINAISRTMLVDFMEKVDNDPKMYRAGNGCKAIPSGHAKSKGASSRYLSMLSHIYQSAKDRYNDEDSGLILIPKSPFSSIKRVRMTHNGQKNIGEELMQRIISYQTTNRTIRRALDTFIISFGMMGANMADLYSAWPATEEWRYNRAKTKGRRADKAEMRVVIQPEIRPYLERMKGDSNHMLSLASDFTSKDTATLCTNRALARWCEEQGVDTFTFYAGRHTWASLARKAGVEKATIDECLCHMGDFDMADIYAERSWELMQEANRKVLDLFKW